METDRSTVWIVDDENDLAEAYAEFLGDSFNMKVFNTAEAALEAFDKGDGADLMVVDLKMPGMDGLEMVEKIRAQGKQVPVIMLSAYAAKNNVIKATSLDVAGFLEKPCDPVHLKSLMDKTLKAKGGDVNGLLVFALKEYIRNQSTLLQMYQQRCMRAEKIVYGMNLETPYPENQGEYLKESATESRLQIFLKDLQSKIDELEGRLPGTGSK